MQNDRLSRGARLSVSLVCLFGAASCAKSATPTTPVSDGGEDATQGGDGGGGDAASDAGVDAAPFCQGAICTTTKIEHLVVIVQENHTFDNYFGTYCTAASGSNPTCTTGPACCEAVPTALPEMDGGPTLLDDSENAAYDPTHLQACELEEIDNGAMDKYVSAAATGSSPCGDPRNIAVVPAPASGGTSVVQTYLDYAKNGALADRYFQPVAGQSSANDMYFASAKFEFLDNTFIPDSIGAQCTNVPPVPPTTLTDTNIGDLLNDAGVPWAYYGAGYKAAVAAATASDGGCPTADPSCPSGESSIGQTLYCKYSGGDAPFAYYASTRDNPAYARDLTDLATDLTSGKLPSVVYVKAFEAFTEHPGYGQTISDGVKFVSSTVSAIESSSVASSTLVVVTWDEGGGFYDHVTPPPVNPADGKPYGTRIPALFIGPFAKKNTVTHSVMEHSSLVKFIEYNWLHGATGQLGNRDTNVNNIGSALDPAATGVSVP